MITPLRPRHSLVPSSKCYLTKIPSVMNQIRGLFCRVEATVSFILFIALSSVARERVECTLSHERGGDRKKKMKNRR